ncbi:MAG TPA: ABC transporter substrate-binding protein [Candidatus Acidoferrales bacterium]|nr:ABC transporter substrate-binding protein [Candidatus Acidoferrales bacterium]
MKHLRILAAVIVLLLVAYRASAQSGLEEVSYGSAGPTGAEWIVYIANDMGFFRQEGLHLSIVVTGSTVSTINQIATGDINFATAGTDSVVNAVARKLAIKIVAPSMVTPPYSLMVSPSITNWQQLKGKTISLATKQEITAIAFRLMAKANHLDWNNDFSIVLAGSTPARYAALQSGNVQGAMLGQPFNFTAETQGMRTLDESFNYMKVWMFDGIAINPAWASAHRPTVVKFIRALRKAAAYGYTHRDDAIKILTTETKSDRAIIEKTYDLDFVKWKAYARDEQLDPKKIQGVIDGVVAQGVLPAPIAVSDVIDTSYAREAAR